MERKYKKEYVGVKAVFNAEGKMKPVEIVWQDGRTFPIDQITDCRRAVSLKVDGTGIRYSCRIAGSIHYLFYEENYKWFVEAKAS